MNSHISKERSEAKMMTDVAMQRRDFFRSTSHPETRVCFTHTDVRVPSNTQATAPGVPSRGDDNGNFPTPENNGCHGNGFRRDANNIHGYQPTSPLPIHTGIQEQNMRCLAKYLSTGDCSDLNIYHGNVNDFYQCAIRLNHIPLRTVCEQFQRHHNLMTSPSNSDVVNSDFTDCGVLADSNNNNYSRARAIMDKPVTPQFQIMFKQPSAVGEANQLYILDVRSMREVERISEVKKIARFGDGFASCSANVKQCPYVFISGGQGKSENTLIKYDVIRNKWCQCANLKHGHVKHSMAFANRCVYVIGGVGRVSTVVEKYDIDRNNCSQIGALPVGVKSSAVVVFENKIFIFGGEDAILGNVSSVQCIDTLTNTITYLTDLPFACSGCQAIVAKDKIYIATTDGHMVQFDPFTYATELCAHQPYHRKYFTLFEVNGRLHIFGGIRTDGCIDTDGAICVFCPVKGTWQTGSGVTFVNPLPVHSSCTLVYPKDCPVRPFSKLFGYC